MFKCGNCARQTEPGETSISIITERREVTYVNKRVGSNCACSMPFCEKCRITSIGSEIVAEKRVAECCAGAPEARR